MLNIFSYAYWPSICLLWRNSVKGVSSFFNGIVLCVCVCVNLCELFVLIYLVIKPLSDASFANIFSHSGDCLFVFLCCAKVCKFDYITSIYFCFYFYCLWRLTLRKHWYDLCQRMFCLCSLLGVLWYHVLCSNL